MLVNYIKKYKIVFLSAFLALLFISCSSNVNQVYPTRSWDKSLNKFFDDGIDFVLNPENLEGTWAQNYSDELDARVEYSDLIATVKINTIREDIDLENHKVRRLYGNIIKIYKGKNYNTEEIQLSVEEGKASFDIILQNERRILNNAFVAYVHWFNDEKNITKNHWHISPATKSVVSLTKENIKRREIKTKIINN